MTTQEIEPLTVSLKTAAKLLGCSKNLAYLLAQRNEFPGAFKIGGRYLVSKKLLFEFINGTRYGFTKEQ
jgi:excisionase family DNA binding protein